MRASHIFRDLVSIDRIPSEAKLALSLIFSNIKLGAQSYSVFYRALFLGKSAKLISNLFPLGFLDIGELRKFACARRIRRHYRKSRKSE